MLPGLGLLRSVYLGFFLGLLGVIASGAHTTAIFFSNLIIYCLLGYNYFHFINLGETARRVRILLEIHNSPEGLSEEEILSKYNSGGVLSLRLARLLRNAQLIYAQDKYFIGRPTVLLFSGIIGLLRKIIFSSSLKENRPLDMKLPDKSYSPFLRSEFFFASAVVLALLAPYYIIFARHFMNGRYIFPGDTYYLWSLKFLGLYSLRHFNTLPWWDPMMYCGQPLYYHFISGPSNYLAPFCLPSLLIFKIASILLNVNINSYIVFHRTFYVIGLNILVIYLIARLLCRNRLAAVFPPLVFAFSYFQLLNFHDFYAVEAMIAPLFYIYALVRFNNARTRFNLLLLVLFTSLYLASLHNAIIMSAFFWSSIFSLLLLVFYPDMVKHVFKGLFSFFGSREGKVILAAAIILLATSTASLLPVYYNAGNVIRYRGGRLDYNTTATFGSRMIPIESSQIWTVVLSWIPFPELSRINNFGWDGHDNRYIGIATLPLILAALFLGARNRYVYILFLTYFISNGFLIYTQNNLFYQFFLDSSELLRSTRNMSTIFPRGGSAIFLLLLAGLGLDALLSYRFKRGKSSNRQIGWLGRLFNAEMRFMIMAGLVLLFLTLQPNSYIIAGLRPTFSYIAIYLIIFCLLCKVLFCLKNRIAVRSVVIVLFILSLADLVISASRHIDERDSHYVPADYHGRMPFDERLAIPSNVVFRPVNNEAENMFPAGYNGHHHNTANTEGIYAAKKEWLALATRASCLKFMPNWNIYSCRMTKYPVFKFFSNGFYMPFTEIKHLDSLPYLAEKEPLFYLHDKKLVYADSAEPQEMNGYYELRRFRPNEAIIETRTDKNGYLYFLDNYDRFWSAYLDAKKVPIYRANFTFKAIRLPLGRHRVRWVYNPWPVKLGYLVFYLILGVFLIMLLRMQKSILQDKQTEKDVLQAD
jgi:hypothetical protein